MKRGNAMKDLTERCRCVGRLFCFPAAV